MKAYILLVACALPALLSAQTTYSVLPKGFEKIQDANYDGGYLGRGGKNYKGTTSYVPMHIQTGYALADLGKPVIKAQTLSYRRNNWYSNNMYKSTQTLVIYMSHSPLDTTAYTTTFATNEGKARAQVFGTGGKPAILNWPAAPYVNNGRKPVPFALKIPLAKPYVIISTGGKSLCIDFSISKRVSTYTSGSNTYNAGFFLDAAGQARGSRVSNGILPTKCRFSNGKWNSSLGYSYGGLTTLGGLWTVRYGNVPAGLVGVATVSGFGVKTKPNPFKLPIDLTALGAPNCFWNVGLETGFWVALKADTRGYMSWPRLMIPKGMTPGSFYDQCLVFDAKANKAGLVVTQSGEWKIVPAKSPKCVTIYKHQDTVPPAKTGLMRIAFAAIIRLDA